MNRPRFDAAFFRVWKEDREHAEEDPGGDQAAGHPPGARPPRGVPTLTAACRAIGDRLGIRKESLRRWIRQAQVDAGEREEAFPSEQERIKQLERENRELREANAILKDAAVVFAGELDPRRRRSSDSLRTSTPRAARSGRSARCCASRACRSPSEPTGRGNAPSPAPATSPTR
ncbi:transposase [Micrococcus luteus]|uniref:transposase n=1 Tax=Micrococcus TaxID=1269 RepID=UPI0019D2E643